MRRELPALEIWKKDRRNTRGKKICFRKYLHFCSLAAAEPEDSALGNEALPATEITRLAAYGNEVKNVSTAADQNAKLVDEMGRGLPLATDPIVNQFLRVRQFRG